MADCRFITDYPALVRHRAELKAAARARWTRLAIALPLLSFLAYGAFSLSPQFGLFVAAVGAGVLFFLWLPGDFLVFNRVRLPDGQLPNGWRELDFIVAGPTGLWIVEVKNTPGHVYVQPDERHWPLARRGGCGGRPNWNAVENPIPQARAQVDSLRRWLLQHGIAADPKPLICLSHSEVAVDNAGASPVPVVVRDQLADRIESGPRRALPGGLLETLSLFRQSGATAVERAA